MWTRRRCARRARLIENHPRFPNRVNAGFMQVVSRSQHPPAGVGARRRRDAGLRHRAPAPRWWPASAWAGWTRKVDVETRGGMLTMEWAGAGRRAWRRC